MFIFLSVCSLLVPLAMALLGYKWKDNPPKDRQGISGYRTTMSRINDETWKYAHKCWGSINFVREHICFLKIKNIAIPCKLLE